MNSNQIKIFLAAARFKSFSLAAQKLFISQSSISYQIGNLERELNVRLFERDSHTVSLTASGESFYESMLRIEEMMKDAILKAQTAGEHEHLLTIGFSGENFIRIGAPYISKFSEAFPDIQVSLQEYRYKDGCTPLFRKEVDLLFIFENEIRDAPLLGFIPLEKCNSYIQTSRENPLSRKKRVEEDELSNQTLLLLELPDGQPAYTGLVNKLKALNTGLTIKKIPDLSVIYLEVASNRGITISPFANSTSRSSNTVSLPFGEHSAFCGLAYRKDDVTYAKANFIKIIEGP